MIKKVFNAYLDFLAHPKNIAILMFTVIEPIIISGLQSLQHLKKLCINFSIERYYGRFLGKLIGLLKNLEDLRFNGRIKVG